MPRSDGVPQTISQAKDCGWSWLNAKCLSCRRVGQIKFDDYLPRHGSTRLYVLADKVVCGRCQGRTLEFGLCAYVIGVGQPWQKNTRIDFHCGEAINPPRD